MNLEECFASVEAALADGDARLSTVLGAHLQEVTHVRLWRGQVLVDWEPDAEAGDCLFRPALLRRLVLLDARVTLKPNALELHASERMVAALSARHAELVQSLRHVGRFDLSVRLRFEQQTYREGLEMHTLIRNGHHIALMRLEADVKVRAPRAASPNTSPLPT